MRFIKKNLKTHIFVEILQMTGFARCWIRENRKTLLDEIDSDFIKTTIKHMEDVPTEVRNTMAQMFLEFVLKKDDYVLALYKTWKENGINFERTE